MESRRGHRLSCCTVLMLFLHPSGQIPGSPATRLRILPSKFSRIHIHESSYHSTVYSPESRRSFVLTALQNKPQNHTGNLEAETEFRYRTAGNGTESSSRMQGTSLESSRSHDLCMSLWINFTYCGNRFVLPSIWQCGNKFDLCLSGRYLGANCCMPCFKPLYVGIAFTFTGCENDTYN